jgi:hypothetical protein
MSTKFIEDLISGLSQAGIGGLNIIIIVPEGEEHEEDYEQEEEQEASPFDVDFDGIFGGGGGIPTVDAILQGPATP